MSTSLSRFFEARTAIALPVSGQGTWESTLQARDLNHDGSVDAYYDTSLNITWLADAFADTPPLYTPNDRALVFQPDGDFWAASLDLHGVKGWRLPKVTNLPFGIGPMRSCSADSDPRLCGANVDTSLSELAHMYYVTLGNQAGQLTNTGPFEQLLPKLYWSGTRGDTSPYVWEFNMATGSQFLGDRFDPDFGGAWAVHDGDVAPVPEPVTIALMSAGLAFIYLTSRRRST